MAGTPWRRGHGAQRLHLTQAAGRRGQRTMLVSSACGNVSLCCREYQDKLPVLRVVFSVMTLDEKNHILWNQDYSATTRAALRNMVAAGLAKMAADNLYPTPTLAHVLSVMTQQQQSTVWQPAATTTATGAAAHDDDG